MKNVHSVLAIMASLLLFAFTASADDEMDFGYDVWGDGNWTGVEMSATVDGFAGGYASGNEYRVDSNSDAFVDLATRDDSESAPAYWASAEYQGSVSSGAWSSGYDGEGLATTAAFVTGDVDLVVDAQDIVGTGDGKLEVDVKGDEEPAYDNDAANDGS